MEPLPGSPDSREPLLTRACQRRAYGGRTARYITGSTAPAAGGVSVPYRLQETLLDQHPDGLGSPVPQDDRIFLDELRDRVQDPARAQ